MLCDDLEEWDKEDGREARGRGYGDVYVHVADSLCCVTEASAVL